MALILAYSVDVHRRIVAFSSEVERHRVHLAQSFFAEVDDVSNLARCLLLWSDLLPVRGEDVL